MTKNEGNGNERRRYVYIFWMSKGSNCKVADGGGREKGGQRRYQAEVNSVEYAPLTQRASKAAHIEHINPKESNQKRQTRTQPHRIPTSNRVT